MKKYFPVVALILLCACKKTPSHDSVKTDAVKKLQECVLIPFSVPADRNELGFTATSLIGYIDSTEGVPIIKAVGTTETAPLTDGKGVFGEVEAFSEEGCFYRALHLAKTGQDVNRFEERSGTALVRSEIPLGALFLTAGRQKVKLIMKLYTYVPGTDASGNPSFQKIAELDPRPFVVMTREIEVNVPEMRYFRFRLNSFRLNKTASSRSYDKHVKYFGTGKPDLVYRISLNSRTLYTSEEQKNSTTVTNVSPMLRVGLRPSEVLRVEVADKDNGFLWIGNKSDLIDVITFTADDLASPGRLPFSTASLQDVSVTVLPKR